jgi:hypothetical protein
MSAPAGQLWLAIGITTVRVPSVRSIISGATTRHMVGSFTAEPGALPVHNSVATRHPTFSLRGSANQEY